MWWFCFDSWKEYFPKLLESTLLCQIFVFWVRDFKFGLLAYFLISFDCAKFQKDWTTFILDILQWWGSILPQFTTCPHFTLAAQWGSKTCRSFQIVKNWGKFWKWFEPVLIISKNWGKFWKWFQPVLIIS